MLGDRERTGPSVSRSAVGDTRGSGSEGVSKMEGWGSFSDKS